MKQIIESLIEWLKREIQRLKQKWRAIRNGGIAKTKGFRT